MKILYQKRLKKEKRTRRRVQEQLEAEVKKRAQYEEALRSNSAETLRLLNESLAQELERERNARAEAEHKMQDFDSPLTNGPVSRGTGTCRIAHFNPPLKKRVISEQLLREFVSSVCCAFLEFPPEPFLIILPHLS
ncbi:hypothetical protein TNIN_183101 [Trichonephila inaurata madagascariensis]|uniref:Uncharacterized protein n=1 Tax=Trichonephila inaurata madagascariensis TaxID=2747483 RepID=A0A8X6MCF3_9ARAC|nr:hypothetical protein TNIN_183101 [Trichonephila inaurata madagascariensis]